MKKNRITQLLTILSLFIPFFMNAQRLPQKQRNSVFAPQNIRIDGNASEWNGRFQAYQVVNRMFYTVSNDDSNLYLTVFLKDKEAVSKILRGGLTFSIDFPPKNTNDISITYPAIPNKRSTALNLLKNSPNIYNILIEDSITNKSKIDSLSLASNQQIEDLFKEIQVTGIKELTEPLISIYNSQNIQVAALLNKRMEYTYELALPLKYLNDVYKSDNFRYNIKLNCWGTVEVPGFISYPPPILTKIQTPNQEDLFRNNPTDFWNEYTLNRR